MARPPSHQRWVVPRALSAPLDGSACVRDPKKGRRSNDSATTRFDSDSGASHQRHPYRPERPEPSGATAPRCLRRCSGGRLHSDPTACRRPEVRRHRWGQAEVFSYGSRFYLARRPGSWERFLGSEYRHTRPRGDAGLGRAVFPSKRPRERISPAFRRRAAVEARDLDDQLQRGWPDLRVGVRPPAPGC